MENRENRTELYLGIAIFIFIAVMYLFFKNMSDKTPSFFARETNYEMIRPKSQMAPDFSLEGREVDYDYNNPFAKKGKKVEDPLKGSVKAAPPKKIEPKKVAKKKDAVKKKPEVTTAVVEKSESGLTASQNYATVTSKPQTNYQTANTQAKVDPEKQKEAEEKRTAQQWRSLLNAQPTKENMDKMLAAYSKGEIDGTAFYLVINDLLKSQKSEVQKVSVYGLSRAPSATSFGILAKNYETVNADVKPMTQAAMNTYGQAAKLDILAQVLTSNDNKVLYYGVQVLNAGLKNMQTVNGRDVRTGTQAQNLAKYTKLVPVIERLKQNPDVQVSQLATQILNQIQQRPQQAKVADNTEEFQTMDMASEIPRVARQGDSGAASTEIVEEDIR